MSPNSKQNILVLAVNYLNNQELVKTYSSLTSKSYANDLNQFFQTVCGVRTIYYDNKWLLMTNSGNSSLIVSSKTELAGQLKELLRSVSSRWAHLSPASRNRKYACLKSFFGWLRENGHLEEDLSSLVICPKVPQRIPHFISLDEALALFASLRVSKDEFQARNMLLVLLLYGAGLRVSEACGLLWKNIHLDERTLIVRGKGGKERKVALIPWLVERLEKFPRTGKYVFGQPMDPRQAYEIVRRSGVAAGLLRPLHPHALRHSFATHMLSSGADLRILQELLGHSSLAATQKYLHLSIDSLSRTMEQNHPLGTKE